MVDGRMDALVGTQHGVASRAQLHDLGLTVSAVRHRLRIGRLHEVEDGVYRLSGAVVTPKMLAMAAVLGGGPDAVLSHGSAAGLLGIPGFSIEPIVITVPRTRRRRGRGTVEQSLALFPHHCRVVDGIPCTSIARTIFDLCGTVHPKKAERTLDTELARRRVTQPALWRVLDDLAVQGRAGVVLLRSLLMARGPRYVPPESELEAEFIRLVTEHGLPAPARQIDLGNADEWVGRVDFVWREQRLVVEVDGAASHDGLVDRRRDAERDAALTAEGWTVVRVRWSEVVDARAATAARLRALLDQSSFRCQISP
jgi:hypothetical protein